MWHALLKTQVEGHLIVRTLASHLSLDSLCLPHWVCVGHSYTMSTQLPLFSCCASSSQVVAGGRDIVHFWDRAGKHHLGAVEDIPDGDVTQARA
jgi:hypothetical protein